MEQRKRERESLNQDCLTYLKRLFERLYNKEISPSEAWQDATFVLGKLAVYFPQKTRGIKASKIKKGLREGLSVMQIARRYGVSRVWVWKVNQSQEKNLHTFNDNESVKK